MKLAVALGIVYVVWGSTYLAIAVADRTLPPLLMLSVRFLIAGALLYAWSRLARRGRGRAARPAPVARGGDRRRAAARRRHGRRRLGRAACRLRASRRSSSRASRSSWRCSTALLRHPAPARRRRPASRPGCSASRSSSVRAARVDPLGATVLLVALVRLGRRLGVRPRGAAAAEPVPLRRDADALRRRRCSPSSASRRASSARVHLSAVSGRVARRAALPDRVRLARRVHRVRLAAAERARRRSSRRTRT